ncbi:hypothetical protein NBRC10513_001523 [Rhodotorula toruloides]
MTIRRTAVLPPTVHLPATASPERYSRFLTCGTHSPNSTLAPFLHSFDLYPVLERPVSWCVTSSFATRGAAADPSSPPLHKQPSILSLPAELLSFIFAPPPSLLSLAPPPHTSLTPAESLSTPLRLSPTAVPICRALEPFARENAWRFVAVKGLERLAKLGEAIERGDVRAETCRLVKGVEVISPGGDDATGDASACEGGLKAVLGALEDLEDVHIALPVPQIDRLLSSPSVYASRAFDTSSAHLTLTLTPNSPSSSSSAYSWLCDTSTSQPSRLSFSSLRHLARHSKGVKKLVIKGRMEIKAPVESEPHAAGFSAFLSAPASLKSLNLRTAFTTDPGTVCAAIPPRARASLETFDWETSGYLARDLDASFALFPYLRSLSLRSSSSALLLTPAFFHSLRSLSHLEHLALHGPRARDAAETCEMVAEWVEGLSFGAEDLVARRDEEAEGVLRLKVLELDVCKPAWLSNKVTVDGKERPLSRAEIQARRLTAACEKHGVLLKGSVLDLVSP